MFCGYSIAFYVEAYQYFTNINVEKVCILNGSRKQGRVILKAPKRASFVRKRALSAVSCINYSIYWESIAIKAKHISTWVCKLCTG